MKNISRICVVTLLLWLSLPAHAQLMLLLQHPQHSVYVNESTPRPGSAQVTLTVLHDWVNPHPIYTSHYLSSLTRQIFDCVQQQSRVLSVTYFEKNMRYGKIILRSDDPSVWQPIPSQGVTHQLWQRACSPSE